NITICRQERGRGGLFINLTSYKSVFVGSSLFFANTVPSATFILKGKFTLLHLIIQLYDTILFIQQSSRIIAKYTTENRKR
uniref:Uncharacterized protein n=1 Tax=Parascaris equorum TaxID=6256 RepID=A0A914RFJ9_PAREQ